MSPVQRDSHEPQSGHELRRGHELRHGHGWREPDGLAAPQAQAVGLATQCTTLLRWQLAAVGPMLPLVLIVQVMMAAGIAVGFGFIIPDISSDTALFLSTGIPTVLLMTIGLVIVPQAVATARLNGTLDYMRSLPIARPLLVLVDLVLWLVVGLPGVAAGVAVAAVRYQLELSISWAQLVGAALLVAITATAVGYAIALTFKPMVAQLLSQVLVFFVLLFSPVTFPASQLPQWFAAVHDALPVRPAADLIRAGLASETFTASGRDVLILAIWAALGLFLAVRAVTRRG
ncbi:ABC transporter permease [Kocuria sp.]|uniref:ABC transporter permease n=1 Tax=Kocuria sp. TaxID=1871328 RepID=UPI0026DFCF69|nr:ABC transporter permease [Kocuria sp.]MDO5618246.1 ABC transporter permease [Kocuria sp.]